MELHSIAFLEVPRAGGGGRVGTKRNEKRTNEFMACELRTGGLRIYAYPSPNVQIRRAGFGGIAPQKEDLRREMRLDCVHLNHI